jgi:hypothetical protein
VSFTPVLTTDSWFKPSGTQLFVQRTSADLSGDAMCRLGWCQSLAIPNP